MNELRHHSDRGYRQARDFLARTSPADPPALQASKFEFVTNLKTAKALGSPSSGSGFRARRRSYRIAERCLLLALSRLPICIGARAAMGYGRQRILRWRSIRLIEHAQPLLRMRWRCDFADASKEQ